MVLIETRNTYSNKVCLWDLFARKSKQVFHFRKVNCCSGPECAGNYRARFKKARENRAREKRRESCCRSEMTLATAWCGWRCSEPQCPQWFKNRSQNKRQKSMKNKKKKIDFLKNSWNLYFFVSWFLKRTTSQTKGKIT